MIAVLLCVVAVLLCVDRPRVIVTITPTYTVFFQEMLIGGFCGRGDLLVVIQNATITETAVDNSEPGLVVVGRLVDMIEVVSRPPSPWPREESCCVGKKRVAPRRNVTSQRVAASGSICLWQEECTALGRRSDPRPARLHADARARALLFIRLSPWAAGPTCRPVPAISLIRACPRGRRWPSTGRLKP